ncbi:MULTISPECIES: DNA repair protein RecO [Methylobacterium]|uniref:DNA repair protein RecO n=3 Tax=Pseudomonadota TaxID=1224 RepID=A0ABQ4SZF4_9HYPH|nr:MULTISPECIES: DNA repair protein RecO [Methylobacterium]PIU07095.1 MAG: DNA repair protein RecO [Methylobacterium sp. CG09_land_8_20_14_0_10_71_15]PIU14217.1 MAG: DNA repair protein RecO [Methylobacterium sp. CG08_land_8_20_14_0_20_71_15]GBU18966.1 DNA repair protein RecO [Methylobacterium sp.]GJE07041.1 DNA repair protein RecO [Methylobacterium jeotgali]
MQWSDEGLVIGLRQHGESGVILEAMTPEHGRHLGLVHGGRSRRMQPVLQPGNRVRLVWRARIDEGLGSFAVEPLQLVAPRLIGSALALYGLSHLGGLLRLLPERDPHPGLYEAAQVLISYLDDPAVAPALMVRFELALLAELGFGLALEACAATGANDALIYVSPRSGRAVSASAGEPYRDRLLPLPAFLREAASPGHAPRVQDVRDGFALTGYFLNQHIWGPRALPPPGERTRFVALGLDAPPARS